MVGKRREAQALDDAVAIGREFAHAVIVACKTGAADVVDARFDPLHGHSRDDGRDDGHHIARIHRHLVAETAADVAAHHTDLAFGHARQHREHGAHQVRRLRRHVDRQVPRGLVEAGHATAGFQRAGVHTRIQDLLAHRHRGPGKGGVGRGLVAGFPGEDVVGVGARAVADFGLVGDVFADDHRILVHGLFRVHDGRQLFVVHLHQRRAIGSGIAVAGQHHGHFLHLEADLFVGQHGLHIAAQRGHPVQIDGLQIIGCQHRHHARAGQRLALVDALDSGVCVGAAHQGAEQHARQLDVVDITALAADELGVFLAQQRGAHALQGIFALLEFGHVAHGCLRWIRVRGQAVTVEAAASLRAADCTALTMFW